MALMRGGVRMTIVGAWLAKFGSGSGVVIGSRSIPTLRNLCVLCASAVSY
jgi:hypothetical protein